MIDLERRGQVCILHWRDGENRFHPDSIGAANAALDEVEKAGDCALVTTGQGKFFSNGLDLAWMGGDGRERAGELVQSVLELFARVLTFPAPTAAAVNGHAFAGGAMLALAHDFRVMRRDRGFLCIPEVDLGLPLHPGMTRLIAARLPVQTAHEAIVTGQRYGGEAALERGFVDALADEDDVVAEACARVEPWAGKRGDVLAALKTGLYPEVLAALRADAEAR